MSNIIWYKHTFANDEYIHPAFHELAQEAGDTGYDYYYLLYPSGLALVLNINQIVDDNVFTYIPSTNSFVCNGYGLDTVNAKLRIRSVTPKTYQIECYSNNILHRTILASADSWTAGSGYSGTDRHSWWCRRSSNPVYIDQSNGKVRWAGVVYDKIDTIMFIDPAIWVWQELSTSSVDIARYPLYKKNNLYYTSTTTKQSDAQYLCAAGDCFSHSNALITLNQGWTKGYASRKKFYGTYHSDLNPENPNSGLIFPMTSRDGHTADVYHTDNERFLSGKFGIIDGNKGYQLSTAPVLANSAGYYIGTNSNKKPYPSTECNRNNPWVLFRNDKDYYQGVQITQKDIFFIDQFILQVKDNQFKIPLNWTVRFYHRESVANTRDDGIPSKMRPVSYGTEDSPSAVASDGQFGVLVDTVAPEADVRVYNDFTETIIPNIEYTGIEKILSQGNTWTQTTLSNSEEDLIITCKITLDISLYGETWGSHVSFYTDRLWYNPVGHNYLTEQGSCVYTFNYNLGKYPIIPGLSVLNPSDSTYTTSYSNHMSFNPLTNSTFCWPDSIKISPTKDYPWELRLYLQTRQHDGLALTNKTIFELNSHIFTQPGLLQQFSWTIRIDPYTQTSDYNRTLHPYKSRNDYTTFDYIVDYGKSNQGNDGGWSMHAISNNQPFVDVVVAYPEE